MSTEQRFSEEEISGILDSIFAVKDLIEYTAKMWDIDPGDVLKYAVYLIFREVSNGNDLFDLGFGDDEEDEE